MPESRILLQSDAVASSAIWARHPEDAADLFERYLLEKTQMIRERNGQFVDTMGDGIFAACPSTSGAIATARLLSADFVWRDRIVVKTRVALHIGPVVLLDGDLNGWGRNEVSRLADAAPAGSVVASSAFERRTESDELYPVGDYLLKDFTGPVPLFMTRDTIDDDLVVCAPRVDTQQSGAELVGRERGLEVVESRIDREYALVVSGPQGVGKTAFCRQLASRFAGATKRAMHVIDVGRSDDPLATAMGQLGIESATADRDLGRFLGYIINRPVVVVLDCETYTPVLAEMVATVRNAHECDGRLLVTFRERKSNLDAATFTLEPLPVEETHSDGPTIAQVLDEELRSIHHLDPTFEDRAAMEILAAHTMGLPGEACRLARVAATVGIAEAAALVEVDTHAAVVAEHPELPPRLDRVIETMSGFPNRCTAFALSCADDSIGYDDLVELASAGLVVVDRSTRPATYSLAPSVRHRHRDEFGTDHQGDQVARAYRRLATDLGARVLEPSEVDAARTFQLETHNLVGVAERALAHDEVDVLAEVLAGSWNFGLMNLNHRLLRVAAQCVHHVGVDASPREIVAIAALAEWLRGNSGLARSLSEPLLAEPRSTHDSTDIAAACAALNASGFELDPVGYELASKQMRTIAESIGRPYFMINDQINAVIAATFVSDRARAIALATDAIHRAHEFRNIAMLAWARYALGMAQLDAHSSDLTHFTEASKGAAAVHCRWVGGLADIALATGLVSRDKEAGRPFVKSAVDLWTLADSRVHVGHSLELAALYETEPDVQRVLVVGAAACGRIAPPLPIVSNRIRELRQRWRAERAEVRMQTEEQQSQAIRAAASIVHVWSP